MSEPFYDPSERSDDVEAATKQIADGGPAFPIPLAFSPCGQARIAPEYIANTDGMSLRDWFAGMAIQGLLANPGGPIQANGMNGWNWVNCTPMQVGQEAYEMADAVIAARGQNKPPRTITAQALLDAYNLGDSIGNNGPHLLRTTADLVQTFAPHTAAELRRKADAEDRALDLVRDGKEGA